jgi:hypothetical protein
MEYPRYRTAARAFPGMVPYSEAAGFVADLRSMDQIDYATIHELSHMWWGGQAYGARMQGREVLNETLAQYSTLMVFKHHDNSSLLHTVIDNLQRGYLVSRADDKSEESPVMYTDDQAYISYGKGALAMFALQEIVGEEKVNLGLRNYLARFAFKPPPFPTSRDLVDELRAVAGPEHQDLITDWFEKIVLYDLRLAEATVTPVGDGFEVNLQVDARQLEADGRGVESETPLNAWFDVALFAEGDGVLAARKPLYINKYRLVTGRNSVQIHVKTKPAFASVDPFRKVPDRRQSDNGIEIR